MEDFYPTKHDIDYSMKRFMVTIEFDDKPDVSFIYDATTTSRAKFDTMTMYRDQQPDYYRYKTKLIELL